MSTEQERADKVAKALNQALKPPRVLTMFAGESGGPCQYCGKYITSGQRYILTPDGFEDHADCREEKP